MERDEHAARDVFPPFKLGHRQAQLLGELGPAVFGQQVEYLDRAKQQPGRHHVGVGVVVDPRVGSVGVAGVELVRAHHTPDDVAVPVAIIGGGAREEPGDLEDDLGALQREELAVPGGLVVLPGVAGDRDAHVALQVRRVRQPAARLRVEMQERALLSPVAAGLPWVHGTHVTGLARRSPRGGQAAVAVGLQRPAQLGQPQVQDGEHEHVIPEDMPAVGLAVQAARGNADVAVHAVGRDRLQQVKNVQPQHRQYPVVLAAAQFERETRPQVRPREHVPPEHFVERVRGLQPVGHRYRYIRGRVVPRGGDGHGLLDRHLVLRGDIDGELVADPPGLRDHGRVLVDVRDPSRNRRVRGPRRCGYATGWSPPQAKRPRRRGCASRRGQGGGWQAAGSGGRRCSRPCRRGPTGHAAALTSSPARSSSRSRQGARRPCARSGGTWPA